MSGDLGDHVGRVGIFGFVGLFACPTLAELSHAGLRSFLGELCVLNAEVAGDQDFFEKSFIARRNSDMGPKVGYIAEWRALGLYKHPEHILNAAIFDGKVYRSELTGYTFTP